MLQLNFRVLRGADFARDPARHLVMPGAVEGTREILERVTRELGPDTYANVMSL